MNNLLKVLFLLILTSCSVSYKGKKEVEKNEFYKIVELYMKEFKIIPNECNEKPYYKVYFEKTEKGIGFWIAAHLGIPGSVVPIDPELETIPTADLIEIKGVIFINKCPLVIYDFQNSNGYGLYNPIIVSKDEMKNFKSIHEGCANVWYPEAWFVEIINDSLCITKKREPFNLK